MMPLITAAGVYPGIGSKAYFSGNLTPERALTSSGIKTLIAKTPADYRYGKPKVATKAMSLGDVAHQLALGDGKGFAIGEWDAWRKNEAKDFKAAAIAEGKVPILREEYEAASDLAVVIIRAIRETLYDIGQSYGMTEPKDGWPYQTEVVFAWQEETAHGPIWCTGMMDVWCEQLLTILDPKVSKYIHDGIIDRQMAAMSWDCQSTFYRRGIEAIFPQHAGRVDFANVIVSPEEPFLWRAVGIDEEARYSCQVEIDRIAALFARCQRADEWPGFPRGIKKLAAKPWTVQERMNRQFEDEIE